jgi:hypothetical protein
MGLALAENPLSLFQLSHEVLHLQLEQRKRLGKKMELRDVSCSGRSLKHACATRPPGSARGRPPAQLAPSTTAPNCCRPRAWPPSAAAQRRFQLARCARAATSRSRSASACAPRASMPPPGATPARARPALAPAAASTCYRAHAPSRAPAEPRPPATAGPARPRARPEPRRLPRLGPPPATRTTCCSGTWLLDPAPVSGGGVQRKGEQREEIRLKEGKRGFASAAAVSCYCLLRKTRGFCL